MSLRPHLLNAARLRVTPSLVAIRPYSDSPAAYPFTKPSGDAQPNPKPTSAYPFTQPSPPTPIATATKPVSRPGPSHDSSQVISREAFDASPSALDYNARPDYRTSSYSPVPHRIVDGSEDRDTLAAAALSGAPTELEARTVRIYKPAKPATQSGDWHAHEWRMDWDILQKGHRWENPLMGWQSSGDFMQGTNLRFGSKEDAVRFAEKQGYEYFVQEHNERRVKPKAYADQFVHSYGKLKQVRTK